MRGHYDGIIYFRHGTNFFKKSNIAHNRAIFQRACIFRHVVRTRTMRVRDAWVTAMVALRVVGMTFGLTVAGALDLRDSPVMENMVDEGETVTREKEVE